MAGPELAPAPTTTAQPLPAAPVSPSFGGGGGGDRDAELAQLHETHGNHFVNQLLDGDTQDAGGPAADTTPLLTPAQAADARGYHTLQPAKYTKPVVTAIQGALGVSAGGTMNEETVQAIARFQAKINRERKPTPPLAVDGKCGPRTLPILIPVGLADDKQVDAFAADVKASGLDKTPAAARLGPLIGAANSRLTAVGVPACGAQSDPDDGANRFIARTWVINLTAKLLDDPDGAASIAYHEARHAEQTFRIARMLAGRKRTVAQIKAELGIEVDAIVESAHAQPLAPGSVEALEAEGWHETELGQKSAEEVDGAMNTETVAMVKAIDAFNQDPTPANEAKARAAFARQHQAYLGYRNLPAEFDGFFLGDKVTDKLGAPRDKDPTFEDMCAQVKAMRAKGQLP